MKQCLAKDKLLHFAVSALMGSALRWCGAEWYWAVAIVMAIGIGKEVYDKVSGKGNCEWGDLLADLLGAVTGGI